MIRSHGRSGTGDEPAVGDPRPSLVALVEGEVSLVLGRAGLGGLRQVQPVWVVAAPPTRRVVMRRYLGHSAQTFSNTPKRSSAR